MRDFAKSVLRLSWGMSLFGVKQMMNMVSPPKPNQPDKVAEAFNSVSQATEEQFDDSFKEAFRAGDQLQEGVVDMASQFLNVDEIRPNSLFKVTSGVVKQTMSTATSLTRLLSRRPDSQ